jgi:hypothetical protein
MVLDELVPADMGVDEPVPAAMKPIRALTVFSIFTPPLLSSSVAKHIRPTAIGKANYGA